MIKKRSFPEHNYRAVYLNGKTMRFAIDPTKPITELDYPEFLDVKITSKCDGKCPWCYMDSKPEDQHAANLIGKIDSYFGSLTQNQKPFQVAIGGGEPTCHPDFVECLKAFHSHGICPNYTTNGMWVNQGNAQSVIKNTKMFCGGVAVSCHPHLKPYWEHAAKLYADVAIKLNFHIIISDKDSVDRFIEIYEEWTDKIDYFVLLPYGAQGRAVEKDIDWDYFVEKAPQNSSKLAFGANFYPYLMKNQKHFDVSLYEPEIMSKFMDMSDMSIHKSSFSLNERN
jgi:organic radical activating enzyme